MLLTDEVGKHIEGKLANERIDASLRPALCSPFWQARHEGPAATLKASGFIGRGFPNFALCRQRCTYFGTHDNFELAQGACPSTGDLRAWWQQAPVAPRAHWPQRLRFSAAHDCPLYGPCSLGRKVAAEALHTDRIQGSAGKTCQLDANAQSRPGMPV